MPSHTPSSKEKELNMEGFSLVEVLLVVLILGIILTISMVSYANISRDMKLSEAGKQISAAIERAKLAARQENVDYRLTFYPSSNPSHGSTFEFQHSVYDDVSKSWVLQPVDKSVGGENVTTDAGHYYIELMSSAQISAGATIDFHPSGTLMLYPSGAQTITFSVGSSSKSVSIDGAGSVTE